MNRRFGEEMQDNREGLEKEVERLRAALAQYADISNWNDIFDDGAWEFKPDSNEQHGGYELAQAALEG